MPAAVKKNSQTKTKKSAQAQHRFAALVESAAYRMIAAPIEAERAEVEAKRMRRLTEEEAKQKRRADRDARKRQREDKRAAKAREQAERQTRKERRQLARESKAAATCTLPVPATNALRKGKDTVYPSQQFDRRINPKNPNWAGFRPRWLIEAEKTVRIAPVNFQHYRAHVHCMSLAQCAAFLRVDVATIAKWEAGLESIPYAAYAALRLAADLQYLPHQVEEWADFAIVGDGPDRGMLLDRRSGEMVSIAEITTIRYVYASASRVATENARLKQQLAALQAEVMRLRGLRQIDGVTAELEAMQERMRALAVSLNQGSQIDINQGTYARQLQEVEA